MADGALRSGWNLPPGYYGHDWTAPVEQICSRCGVKWSAKMRSDFNCADFVNDRDRYCPKCGAEAEEDS